MIHIVDLTFNEAEHYWSLGLVTDAEMRAFAQRWAEGKMAHRVRNGLVEESMPGGHHRPDWWRPLRGAWNHEDLVTPPAAPPAAAAPQG